MGLGLAVFVILVLVLFGSWQIFYVIVVASIGGIVLNWTDTWVWWKRVLLFLAFAGAMCLVFLFY